VTTLLGLEPGDGRFETDPRLPDGIRRIELDGRSSLRSESKLRSGHARVEVPIAASNGGVNGVRAEHIFARLEELFDPAKTRGERASYRFEIVGVGTWAFAVDDGRIVRRGPDEPADCVIRMNEETFIRINSGEGSPVTAFLRGAMAFEGDLLLVSKLDKYAR
jgi:SCP-2 sterol transfer family protein